MPLSQKDASDLKSILHAKDPELLVHVVHRSEDEGEVEVEGTPEFIAKLTSENSPAGAAAKRINDTKAVFE